MFFSLDLGLYVSQLLHTEFPNWGAQGIGLFVCEKIIYYKLLTQLFYYNCNVINSKWCRKTYEIIVFCKGQIVKIVTKKIVK